MECLFFVLFLSDHHSGPHRIVDKLFANTRYFVMKSNNYENVQIGKDRVSNCQWVGII